MVAGQAVAISVGGDMEVIVVSIEEIVVVAPGFEERESVYGFVVDVVPCVFGETHGVGGWVVDFLGRFFWDH
jgi:hypothetical protein